MNLRDERTRNRAKAAARMLTTLVIALTSTVVIALAGCADASGIAPTAKLVAPESVGVAASASAAAASAPVISAEWWRGFDDAALNDVVEKAIGGAPSLRVAEARVAKAAANAGVVKSAQGLQVSGEFDISRQLVTENGVYPPPLAGSILNFGTAQVNGSWELDLFGRRRADFDAAVGAERAAEADAAAARVLLAVNVARTYVQLARLVEQRTVLQRALAQRDELLSLIRQRVAAGLDTTVELRQGEGALPETRQQIDAIDEQIELSRHALAALAALPPDAYAGLTPHLSSVRAVPLPGVVPADLLGRRADIIAARWRVEAATRDVASVRAQFYPNVNLIGFVGLSSIGFDRFFEPGSKEYGFGPAISLPIFNSGRLRSNLSGKSADLDVAIDSYNGNVIDAVHDVADQITSTRSIERQQKQQTEALAAAESAYDAATQRYRAGLATYLTVLNAETNVLSQRRSTVDLRARVLDSQMLLVRALGGGYVAAANLS